MRVNKLFNLIVNNQCKMNAAHLLMTESKFMLFCRMPRNVGDSKNLSYAVTEIDLKKKKNEWLL